MVGVFVKICVVNDLCPHRWVESAIAAIAAHSATTTGSTIVPIFGTVPRFRVGTVPDTNTLFCTGFRYTRGNGIHYVVYSCEAVVESLTLLSNVFRYIV